MIEENMFNLFLNNGFAVFVAGYTLTRLEKAMKENQKIIRSLEKTIQRCYIKK